MILMTGCHCPRSHGLWPIWAPSWDRGGDSQQEEAVDRLAKDLERESGDLDENLLQAPRADYNWHGCRMSWI